MMKEKSRSLQVNASLRKLLRFPGFAIAVALSTRFSEGHAERREPGCQADL
jgi:hypothetical protein